MALLFNIVSNTLQVIRIYDINIMLVLYKQKTVSFKKFIENLHSYDFVKLPFSVTIGSMVKQNVHLYFKQFI